MSEYPELRNGDTLHIHADGTWEVTRMSGSRSYYWPVTITQQLDGMPDADITWVVNGREQAEMLPPLPKGVLAAYGAMRGQSSSVTTVCSTPQGLLVVSLTDARSISTDEVIRRQQVLAHTQPQTDK